MGFPYLSKRPFITDTSFLKFFYPPRSKKRYSSYGLVPGTVRAFVNLFFCKKMLLLYLPEAHLLVNITNARVCIVLTNLEKSSDVLYIKPRTDSNFLKQNKLITCVYLLIQRVITLQYDQGKEQNATLIYSLS